MTLIYVLQLQECMIINITIVTRALREHKPVPMPKFETKLIQIFELIRIRMSVVSVPKCCECIVLLVSVISAKMVQIGHRLYEKN